MNLKLRPSRSWSIAVISLALVLSATESRGMDSKGALFRQLSPDAARRVQQLEQPTSPLQSKAVVRTRHVELDRDQLLRDVIAPGLKQQKLAPVYVRLFDDVEISIVTEQFEEISPGRQRWIGSVDGNRENRAVFVLRENNVLGNIRISGRLFQIRPTPVAGVHSVTEIDTRRFPNELPPDPVPEVHEGIHAEPGAAIDQDEAQLTNIKGKDPTAVSAEPPSKRSPSREKREKENVQPGKGKYQVVDILPRDLANEGSPNSSADADDLSGKLRPLPDSDLLAAPSILDLIARTGHSCAKYVDVLVGYTETAKDASADIEGEIELAITESNDSYANSGISTRLRLIHAEEVTYSESGNIELDRNRLRDPDDGRLDVLHSLRRVHDADLVSLWVEMSDDGCGIAFIMDPVGTGFQSSGFSVVVRSCATGNYSFGHELGHNMSARHDWYVDDTDNSPFTFNHGFVSVANSWRTVMAYNDQCVDAGGSCVRLQYWSNPDVSQNGVAMGIAEGQPNAADNRKTLNTTVATVASFQVGLYESGGEAWGSGNYATSIAFGDVLGNGRDQTGVTRHANINSRYFVFGPTDLLSGGSGWGSGNYATSIAFGDVDGDGRDEIGIARRSDVNARYWVLDDANAGFTTLLSGGTEWGSGNYATSIAFGDVDGDGRDEIGLARRSDVNARYWVLDDATAGFTTLLSGGTGWGSGNYATSIAFGDVDGDGRDEIGLARRSDVNARYWVLNDASAGFAPLLSGGSGWGSGNYATSIAFGDVDGDGHKEIGLGRRADVNARYWVLDDARCTFKEMLVGGSGWGSGNYATSIAFGDVDDDGKDEVGIGRKANQNSRYWILDLEL
jgi:hypothetical protein